MFLECVKNCLKNFISRTVIRRCSFKKMFLKISQILQENTCAATSFLQEMVCNFVKKDTPAQLLSSEFCKMFKNTLFTEHFRTTASGYRNNNMPRGFKTKCEKNESNDILITYLYILMASTCNTSIHQTTSACKNKAKRYQFIPNHKAKIITFFI